MSTNSLQLNWNSQILTEEDGHFKLLGRDKEPTKYTCTTGTLSVFWTASFCQIRKIKINMKRRDIRVFKHKVHVRVNWRPKSNMTHTLQMIWSFTCIKEEEAGGAGERVTYTSLQEAASGPN